MDPLIWVGLCLLIRVGKTNERLTVSENDPEVRKNSKFSIDIRYSKILHSTPLSSSTTTSSLLALNPIGCV